MGHIIGPSPSDSPIKKLFVGIEASWRKEECWLLLFEYWCIFMLELTFLYFYAGKKHSKFSGLFLENLQTTTTKVLEFT